MLRTAVLDILLISIFSILAQLDRLLLGNILTYFALFVVDRLGSVKKAGARHR